MKTRKIILTMLKWFSASVAVGLLIDCILEESIQTKIEYGIIGLGVLISFYALLILDRKT